MLLSGLNQTREVPHQILDDSARVYPEKIAIEELSRGQISYGELASLSQQKSPRVLQHIAPKIENHLLLEAGGDKTVHNRQRVLDAHDHQGSHHGKNDNGQFPRSKKMRRVSQQRTQWMDCVVQRQIVAENDRTHFVSSAEHDGLMKTRAPQETQSRSRRSRR